MGKPKFFNLLQLQGVGISSGWIMQPEKYTSPVAATRLMQKSGSTLSRFMTFQPIPGHHQQVGFISCELF
jgi:hypothetical protein